MVFDPIIFVNFYSHHLVISVHTKHTLKYKCYHHQLHLNLLFNHLNYSMFTSLYYNYTLFISLYMFLKVKDCVLKFVCIFSIFLKYFINILNNIYLFNKFTISLLVFDDSNFIFI